MAKKSRQAQTGPTSQAVEAQNRGGDLEYTNLWQGDDLSKPGADNFQSLHDYLEPTIRPLVGLKTIQILLLREALDYLVLRTEETREVNDVVTPSSRSDQPDICRVAFLGGKQKAVESRELERLLRDAVSDFDRLSHQSGKECFLNQNLCLSCPRCGLFGATSTESGKGQKPNIKHRIQYSTAFSLIPYEEIVEELTFNAIEEQRQITDRALNSRPCVRPGTLFASCVTLRSATPHELLLTLKVLLQARSYGAESRTQGDVRNHIVGIVAGWEEVITPLELTLELEKALDKVMQEKTRADAIRSAVTEYVPLCAHPSKIRLLCGSDGANPTDKSKESSPSADVPGQVHVEGLDGLLKAVRSFELSKAFLERAYADVANLRARQGETRRGAATGAPPSETTPEAEHTEDPSQGT